MIPPVIKVQQHTQIKMQTTSILCCNTQQTKINPHKSRTVKSNPSNPILNCNTHHNKILQHKSRRIKSNTKNSIPIATAKTERLGKINQISHKHSQFSKQKLTRASLGLRTPILISDRKWSSPFLCPNLLNKLPCPNFNDFPDLIPSRNDHPCSGTRILVCMTIRKTINKTEKAIDPDRNLHIVQNEPLRAPRWARATRIPCGRGSRWWPEGARGLGLGLGFLLTGRGPRLGGIARSGGSSAGGNISYHKMRLERIQQ